MSDYLKTELRVKFKNIRNSINENCQIIKSQGISSLFFKNFSFAQNYFAFLSFGSEVKTGDIIKRLTDDGKNVYIPKCDTDNLIMKPVKYCADDLFSKNSYGIMESNTDNFFQGNLDVILLPGLTADRHGNRIGYGKGYYDKFINSLNYKPILVGLFYKEQIFDGILPNEHNDVRLDYIITDSEIITISGK